jgi:putative heme-binding domain-containing protein
VLQKSADAAVRARAAALFKAGASKRADVLAEYQKALELTGDPAKGKVVFKDVCSTCHRLEDVGIGAGPDLVGLREKGQAAVLTSILDPNREVAPQYYTYVVTTDAGLTITGLITAETATTLTLRRADGTTATVQRVNIEHMESTGLSAMPDGLERQVGMAAMADLLAYLNSVR